MVTVEVLKSRIPESEFTFKTSRSGGPGGQNVNKVSTKVEIHFDFQHFSGLSENEKKLISGKLANRINATGELIVKSQSERSQLENRKKAIEKMFIILSKALTENPGRVPTNPTLKSQIKRLEEKHKRGLMKKLRKESGDHEE